MDNLNGNSRPLEVVNMEGSAAVEVHDLCVGSHIYWNVPNEPSRTNDYANAEKQKHGNDSTMGW